VRNTGRPYLYLIGTTFPFGFQEPFIETELKYIAPFFKTVYVVIPESQNISNRQARYALPENVEVVLLKCAPKTKYKFKGLLRFFHPSFRQEIQLIRGHLKLKFSLKLARILVGYFSMACAFKNELERVISHKQHKPSEVTLYSYWITYATAGIALMREQNKAYHAVSRTHGWDCFFDRSSDNYLPLRYWLSQHLNSICPVTQAGFDHLLKKLPDVDESKLRVHKLGVEQLAENNLSTYTPGMLRILTISFVQPVKRIELLVNALAEITDIPIEWVQIGDFLPETQWIQRAIETKLSTNKNIQYTFLGALTNLEVQQYLAEHKSDFLVCTSSSEGLPVSMMEANCYGIPVVSTAVGGVPEIIHHGLNGFLLSPNPTIHEISKQLRELASISPADYLLLQQAGYQIYQQQYCSKTNMERFAVEELNGTRPA
jgi:glycosyltransferase involved in cell wall biosynthesis